MSCNALCWSQSFSVTCLPRCVSKRLPPLTVLKRMGCWRAAGSDLGRGEMRKAYRHRRLRSAALRVFMALFGQRLCYTSILSKQQCQAS
jgi:hypothetical protein